jgi:hypothetical protein
LTAQEKKLACIEKSIEVYKLRIDYWLAVAITGNVAGKGLLSLNASAIDLRRHGVENALKRADAFIQLAYEATEEYKALIYSI